MARSCTRRWWQLPLSAMPQSGRLHASDGRTSRKGPIAAFNVPSRQPCFLHLGRQCLSRVSPSRFRRLLLWSQSWSELPGGEALYWALWPCSWEWGLSWQWQVSFLCPKLGRCSTQGLPTKWRASLSPLKLRGPQLRLMRKPPLRSSRLPRRRRRSALP